jgi:hypothetical protein
MKSSDIVEALFEHNDDKLRGSASPYVKYRNVVAGLFLEPLCR